jgi:hypothetical protein
MEAAMQFTTFVLKYWYIGWTKYLEKMTENITIDCHPISSINHERVSDYVIIQL